MYNQTAVLPISKERAAYLHKQKRKKYMIRTIQISVVIILLAMWEILANIGVIDSFIMSQPSRMVKTLLNLGENGLLTLSGRYLYGNADRIFARHGAGSWSGGAVVVVENAFSHL